MLISNILALALSAGLGVAIPISHGQRMLNSVPGKPCLKSSKMPISIQRSTPKQIIKTIGETGDAATAIAGKAANLGDSNEAFDEILKLLQKQQDGLMLGIRKALLSGRVSGDDEQDIYDAFELLGHGLAGEFDILLYKADVINKSDKCDQVLPITDESFKYYTIYMQILAGLDSDDAKYDEFLKLFGDASDPYDEFRQAISCESGDLAELR